MTIAYWCVLAAAVLPYVFTILAKSSGRYNNHAPRDFLDKQEGYHKRAHWAQLNGFEAFPPFAAAVIIASSIQGVNLDTIDMLAVGFIVARIAYGIAYIADKPSIRSLVWMAGLACVIGIFFTAA